MYLIALFRSKVFTIGRLGRLMMHVFRYGIQLNNVMHMIEDRRKIAIVQGDRSLSYEELFRQTASVSGYLYKMYRLRQGSRVLVIVDNSIPSVVLMFALSALGCNIHLIAPMKDHDQFKRTVDVNRYDFIFSGIEVKLDYYEGEPVRFLTTDWHDALQHEGYKPFISHRTNLSLFTSGSTGTAKNARRSNTLWQYLKAIADLVEALRIQNYKTVILPVPVYHSYGLSALFLSLMLNKTLYLVTKFDSTDVSRIIRKNNVDVAILVPQMLSKLLGSELKSLRCIVSCADVLPTQVLQSARRNFGEIVFNLYGTSETGLATIATPGMLAEKPATVGRPINGCKVKLVHENGHDVVYVKSAFAMSRGSIRTGDMAIRDERGWYYLKGRIDHMLVINGTNVYPNELLEMIYKHEAIQHAEVRTFVNDQGFKKIKLLLQLRNSVRLDEQHFKDWWLQQYGTKFLPSVVEFASLDQRGKLM